MAKRSAVNDLNHDNWDRDDEVEEAGTFKQASAEALKGRVMKTARRRNTGENTVVSEDGNGKKPIFGGFTGFSSFAPPNPNAAFSFLNNSNTVKTPSNTTTIPLTSATTTSIVEISKPMFSNGIESKTDVKSTNIFANFGSLKTTTSAPKTLINSGKEDKVTDPNQDKTEYFAKLKGLNESVLSWIEKHVKENPFISLKPIFTDYERYLTELDVDNVAVNSKKDLVGFTFKSTKTDEPNADKKESTEDNADKVDTPTFDSSFSFGTSSKSSASTPSNDKEKGNSPPPKFVFGSANAAKSLLTVPTTFGDGSSSGLFASKPFASTGAPFSFGATSAATPAFASTPAHATETQNEENEDQPPKVEFTPVVEKNYIYTIRCKVYVKKEGNYANRGCGNMFLKKVPDSEKTQLIVRADTNLGNLLCNFILSESVPTQRMGKNNVMLVCIPMPDEKPPPVPILLRVKDEAVADALLKELEKHKK